MPRVTSWVVALPKNVDVVSVTWVGRVPPVTETSWRVGHPCRVQGSGPSFRIAISTRTLPAAAPTSRYASVSWESVHAAAASDVVASAGVAGVGVPAGLGVGISDRLRDGDSPVPVREVRPAPQPRTAGATTQARTAIRLVRAADVVAWADSLTGPPFGMAATAGRSRPRTRYRSSDSHLGTRRSVRCRGFRIRWSSTRARRRLSLGRRTR